MRNGFVQSFCSRIRDEPLDETLLGGPAQNDIDCYVKAKGPLVIALSSHLLATAPDLLRQLVETEVGRSQYEALSPSSTATA
ncbi:hypothetical protein SZ64_15025 [Erythrobacter sp. SG61-1L]|nr:hypothetical protein SZ64_15025 [Erythrobacter sp. SG61-1L]